MLNILINACDRVVADTDFWLLSILGDYTLEETSRPCFTRYLKSWKDLLPEDLLQRAQSGINERLKVAIEEQNGTRMKVSRNQCYNDSKCRSDIALVTEVPSRTWHIEVKYVFDCTYPKQYKDVIPADSKKPLDYQVVFFAAAPHYRYPSGTWYGKKWESARKTVFVGIENQYAELCKHLRPADYRPHPVDLPTETNLLSEDRIRARLGNPHTFQPDKPWDFCASNELKNAQVAYALWDWSQPLHQAF